MSIYDIKVKDSKGEDVSLEKFKGKVMLIVNTATGCGFTPQYTGLEGKMLTPVLKKMDPDYKNNNNIKWNFTKFLVDKEGNVVERYEPTIKPEKIEEDIIKLL